MNDLIRFDDRFEDTAAAEGFGTRPPLVPPRPDPALTALVTGMALAVCIALAATAMSFGRVHSGQAAAPGLADSPVALAAQPLHPRT